MLTTSYPSHVRGIPQSSRRGPFRSCRTVGVREEIEVSLLELVQRGYVEAGGSDDRIKIDKSDPDVWQVELHGS